MAFEFKIAFEFLTIEQGESTLIYTSVSESESEWAGESAHSRMTSEVWWQIAWVLDCVCRIRDLTVGAEGSSHARSLLVDGHTKQFAMIISFR